MVYRKSLPSLRSFNFKHINFLIKTNYLMQFALELKLVKLEGSFKAPWNLAHAHLVQDQSSPIQELKICAPNLILKLNIAKAFDRSLLLFLPHILKIGSN